MADEQSEKLPFGKLKSCVTFFKESVLVHVSCFPLILSFVGNPSANIGILLSLLPDVLSSMDPVRTSADFLLVM